MMRAARLLLFVALAVSAAWAPTSRAGERRWDDETLKLFAALPVQDEGRVKPLDTYARFKLLKLNGRRSFRDGDGRSGSALAWLLDCLFFPEEAARYETFVVDNSDVIVALGLPEKSRRDRYSYEELAPARDRLYELAGQYGANQGTRSLLENQVINLANNVHDFELLASYLDFARLKFDVGRDVFTDIFPGKTEVRFREVLAKAPELKEKFAALSKDSEKRKSDLDAVRRVMSEADAVRGMGTAIRIVPPPDPEQTEWATPADIIELMIMGNVQ
ncbi:MAG: hypothetical protein NTZ09_05720, partial [Candidatus Hydrogenedentes bacterium]|nr:hypothetical protein [Candidatus Hydrogenedentota bacterium]